MADVAWTIVVPVLNEGPILGRFLERLYMLSSISRCEVLIVDGGSSDHTRDAFIEASRIHPRLFLLESPPGKGLGLRRAFMRAKGKFIAFMDGDLQYSPADLPKLMHRIEKGAELVVTRRKVAWADYSPRRLTSRAFVHFSRGLLGLPVSDPQSGMKALRASLLPRIHLSAKDWGLDVQLIRSAHACGAQIEEVEIDFYPRPAGKTKTGLFSTSLDLLSTALEESSHNPSVSHHAPNTNFGQHAPDTPPLSKPPVSVKGAKRRPAKRIPRARPAVRRSVLTASRRRAPTAFRRTRSIRRR